MVHVAVTGAAGNVGREVIGALDNHRITAFTHREHDDIESELLDVGDADAVTDALSGIDVVVHLAGASSPDASWDAVVDTNIRGTKHVYEAAVENDVNRVVFASSNHAVGMYNVEDSSDTESVVENPRVIDSDDPPRPDSFYGISKIACEGVSNYYADRHGIESINIRIGWYLSEENLAETRDESPEKSRFARAMWLSPRDCRDVIRQAVEADLRTNPLTVNAVSRNDERVLSLTETQQELGYRPRDNASEVLESQ